MERERNQPDDVATVSGQISPRARRTENRTVVDEALERVAFLLDDWFRIPGTKIRFGLDSLLGLIMPGVGDTVTVAASAYILLRAVRYGLPKITILRMVWNIAIDYVIGTIPFLGDLFDFAWKANRRNVQLLNEYAEHRRSTRNDWLFLFALLALLAGLISLLLIGAYMVVESIWRSVI